MQKHIVAGIIVALAAYAAPASAQVAGHVAAGTGERLHGARVELWGERSRLAVAVTDAQGAFGFSASDAAGSVAILVQRIGFLPARVPVAAPAAGVRVRLSEAPVALDAVEVRAAAPIRCPSRDEPGARSLWQAASRRYSRATDSIWIRSEMDVVLGEGRREQIGDAGAGPPLRGHRETAGYRRIVGPRAGYGYRIDGSMDFVEGGWRYTQLGSHDAQHFIDPSFGVHNVVAVVSRTPDRTVLGFCSRGLSRGAVQVAGTLSIAADTTIAEARWHFRTPSPREEAGGEVIFAPYAAGGADPWLVPASSLVWRRVLGTRERFRHRAEWYTQWKSVPPRH